MHINLIFILFVTMVFGNCLTQGKERDSASLEFFKITNSALESKDIIITKSNLNDGEVLKVERSPDEIKKCLATVKDLEEKLIKHKEKKIHFREKHAGEFEKIIINFNEKIKFFNSKFYYSYRVKVSVLETIKGNKSKKSSYTVLIKEILTNKKFRLFGLGGHKKTDNSFLLMLFGDLDQKITKLSDTRYSFLEYVNKKNQLDTIVLFKKICFKKMPLIELLVLNEKELNSFGVAKLKQYDLFKKAERKDFKKIWFIQKKLFNINNEYFTEKNKVRIKFWKSKYLINTKK